MPTSGGTLFSGFVTAFQGKPLPERARLAGYAALIDAYELAAPAPRTLCAIGERHRILSADGWRILTPRHAPAASLEGHLTFALKNEGVDLAVLKRLFSVVSPHDLAALVRSKPAGAYARRIWFLYEWLTATQLDMPDATSGGYATAIDPEMQFASAAANSPRHRVKNNMPGTPAFCPLVFRTEPLKQFATLDLPARVQAAVADVPRDLLARAAAFLLLKDSKSSYAIEGEHPPQDRLQRWGRAIAEAGLRPLDLEELLRLQKIVLGDTRFVRLGLREEGGFVGGHDRDSGAPLPDHISARADDLRSLIDGLVAFDRGAAKTLDPIVAAAILSFGFVYVHPFADGNGRVHRYLIHHVLARRGFNPRGVVFPVSAAMLARLGDYRRVLEDTSRRLLPLIAWRPTATGNVEVLNETADYYRYFDATPHAEFLYACVRATIDEDLPEEARFLKSYDRFRAGVAQIVEMPEDKINLLFQFLKQNAGSLSKRAREREFAALTAKEATVIEAAYREAFAVD